MTQTFSLPRQHSWVDSFAASDKSCPFSPRYRTLAPRKETLSLKLKKPDLLAERQNKENSNKVHALQKSQNAVFSPRYQNRKKSLHNVDKLSSNILSPRYRNMRSPRSIVLLETEQDSESSDVLEDFDARAKVFSPRYGAIVTPKLEETDSEAEDESVAKLTTVFALLENLNDSCSEVDDDVSVVD